MKILFADDTPMHQSFFQSNLNDAIQNDGVNVELLAVAGNGQALMDSFEQHAQAVDVVFTDIRMPVLDGLGALVKIKAMKPTQKVMMVSSENVSKMTAINLAKGLKENASLDLAKKKELLDRVAARVRSGTVEEGKINSILEGCEKLAADPVEVAATYGAQGYIVKPYDKAKLVKAINDIQNPKGFILIE